MTTILEVIAACQRVNNVTGVRTCPENVRDYPVGEIAQASMPLVMTIPETGNSQFRSVGGKHVREARDYRIRVITAVRDTGIGWEKQKETIVLLERMMTAWFDPENDVMTAANMEFDYTEVVDTGYRENIKHAGREYHGFEIIVNVSRITISD